MACAALVLWEKSTRLIGKEVKWGVFPEISVVITSIIAAISAFMGIHYQDALNRIKDADLAAYEKAADLKIAQANKDASVGNQKAQEAKLAAAKASHHGGVAKWF